MLKENYKEGKSAEVRTEQRYISSRRKPKQVREVNAAECPGRTRCTEIPMEQSSQPEARGISDLLLHIRSCSISFPPI